MRVLMLAINDPAGACIALCKALRTHTTIEARLVTLETRYNHCFQHDVFLPEATANAIEGVRDMLALSDIFHFHMTADEFTRFGPFLPADYLRDKVIVHHHHGHPDFRSNPEKYQNKYRKRSRGNLLVSTPDLLRILPEAKWQPNLVPQEDALYRPVRYKNNACLRIGHSPTNKLLKNTDAFLRVTQALTHDPALPPNKPVLMDNIPHRKCLAMKRCSDIFFDHMQGYFGLSSLEALSQGVPTIAGLDEWNLQHIEGFAGKSPPWILARDESALEQQCRKLLADAVWRQEKGEQSRQFMEQAWSEKQVVSLLETFYTTL